MMNEKNLKNYEAPSVSVTQIKAEDIIMASGTLIKLEDSTKLMGKGKINWIDIQ